MQVKNDLNQFFAAERFQMFQDPGCIISSARSRPFKSSNALFRPLIKYGYDTKDFVADVRTLNATPHVAQKKHSAIDGRTTRHEGYKISQQKRKRVEEIFGWMKTVGGLRKLRHRGSELVGWMFTFTAAAYNLVRIRNLSKSVAGANA